MRLIYKIMFFVSISLVVLAVVLVAVFGLNFGTDFRGGSLIEIKFDALPEISVMQDVLKSFPETGEAAISQAGEKSLILRFREIDEATHQKVLDELRSKFGTLQEDRFDSVGAVIGRELKSKSITAVTAVLILIIFYIALVFRKLSSALSPLVMGLAAMVALAHDVLIPIGVFAFLGRYYGVEITAVFVAAILTILGYSISDTVVVFDRVRENVLRSGFSRGASDKEGFGSLVHKSIMQTLTRSLNTTFTTLLSLVAIYFFGGESLRYFSLALIIGIFLGAYSSIFVASPILYWWSKKR